MSNLMLDVDQAGELKAAFRRGNWTNAEIKQACEGDFLARALTVLRGSAEITAVRHVIDCDADPLIPYPVWKVEAHAKRGQVVWDRSQHKLHLSPNQMNGKRIQGNKLRKELENIPTENANVMDYLLAHPHLIPEEWKVDENGKTRFIFFWGTIYRDFDGDLCVRCIYFRDGHWRARFHCLDIEFDGQNPSLLRAS